MKKSLLKRSAVFIGFFFLSLCLSALFLFRIAMSQKQRAVEHGSYILESEANKIQYSIDSRLLKLEVLELIIVDNQGMVRDFYKIAQRLYENDPSLRSLQLAPDGVVSYVYPLKGNEEAFGDLFADPDRREEAEYARDTGNTTLAGPFELYQGGLGAVARRPIYLEDAFGQRYFWGFSIAVMDVPEIFDKAELDKLEKEGYLYKIWRKRPGTEEIQIITESGPAPLTDPILGAVHVPGAVWTISIAPRKGWIPADYLIPKMALALLISVLAALTAYGFVLSEQQKRELKILASTDSLTGLYNERQLASTLKQMIRTKHHFGLLYLDLDKFKQVNDSYGHDVGDKLLIETALRIRQCIRENDFAFRIGGDEFAVIISGEQDIAFYNKLEEQIRSFVGRPFVDGEISLCPRISCGYSRYPQDQSNIEDLIKSADQKMYRMKQQTEGGAED